MTVMNPVPVLGWDASRPDWLASRRDGIGASDVAALLGFSHWQTPWELWAEKSGNLIVPEKSNEAISLGHDLEPWLIAQAPALLNVEVTRTPHMLYAHGEHDWRRASPDAFASDAALVEAKTAKLAGWGDPEGWEDGGIPLGYELQGRWQMHVMNRPKVHFVALVAGLGRITRTITRDLPLEYDLVQQVSEWRQEHLIEGAEPAIDGRDLAALNQRYRRTGGEEKDLTPTDALKWQADYKAGAALKKQGDELQALPKVQFRSVLGAAAVGKVGDKTVVTWNETKGEVDYKRMAEELAANAGVDMPDPELYRKPSGRTLLVK